MLLQPSKPEMAYLKMGIYGAAGSGKSFTSSNIAIGLRNFIKSEKAIAYLDTETGSDFVRPIFENSKTPLVVAKTRAFQDLLSIVDEAEETCSVLIIDSITHFWNEMLTSYQKKMNIKRITLRHWPELKQTWGEFADKYINSKLHIIMAGRVGYIWDDVEDENGIKELKKVGTKMKAEVETGHEPSLLVEMEQARISSGVGAGWFHRAWIIKDRFDVIDGKFFDNPDFESILPHVQLLNLGGEHRALDTDRNSQDMFEKGNTGAEYYKKREQTLEKIKNEINLMLPGQDAKTKTDRILLTKEIFGTHSWSEICEMDVATLMNGLTDIETKHSKLSDGDKKEPAEKKGKK